MTNKLDEAQARLRRFGELEARGSSPLYEQLAIAASTDRELSGLLLAAPEEQRRATLFFAAVHYLVMQEPEVPLARFYPSVGGTHAGDPMPAFRELCLARADSLRALMATRRTQTNEVRRSAAWLPVLGRVAESTGARLAIVEVGASAGLTLLLDRYRYDYGRAGSVGAEDASITIAPALRGPKVPPVPRMMPPIGYRVGIDLEPIDAWDEDKCLWLRACIWPEHREREALLRRAIEVARADPPAIVTGDAVELLPRVLARIPADLAACVIHSTTLPYLDHAHGAAFADVMTDLSKNRDLVWVSFEGCTVQPFEYEVPPPQVIDEGPVMACATARVSHGQAVGRVVGYSGPHGDWLRWLADPLT